MKMNMRLFFTFVATAAFFADVSSYMIKSSKAKKRGYSKRASEASPLKLSHENVASHVQKESFTITSHSSVCPIKDRQTSIESNYTTTADGTNSIESIETLSSSWCSDSDTERDLKNKAEEVDSWDLDSAEIDAMCENRSKELEEAEAKPKQKTTGGSKTTNPAAPQKAQEIDMGTLKVHRTCRLKRAPNTKTLYHATSLENAQNILKSMDFRPGRDGLNGGGIYFADQKEKALWRMVAATKSTQHNVVLECKVNLGNIQEHELHKDKFGKPGTSEDKYTEEKMLRSEIDSLKITGSHAGTYMISNNSFEQIDMLTIKVWDGTKMLLRKDLFPKDRF